MEGRGYMGQGSGVRAAAIEGGPGTSFNHLVRGLAFHNKHFRPKCVWGSVNAKNEKQDSIFSFPITEEAFMQNSILPRKSGFVRIS